MSPFQSTIHIGSHTFRGKKGSGYPSTKRHSWHRPSRLYFATSSPALDRRGDTERISGSIRGDYVYPTRFLSEVADYRCLWLSIRFARGISDAQIDIYQFVTRFGLVTFRVICSKKSYHMWSALAVRFLPVLCLWRKQAADMHQGWILSHRNFYVPSFCILDRVPRYKSSRSLLLKQILYQLLTLIYGSRHRRPIAEVLLWVSVG